MEEKNERLRELDESLTKLHAKKEKYDNRKDEVDQKMSNLKSEEIVQGLQRKAEYKDSMDAAERMMIRSKRAVDGADTNVKDMKKERDNQKRLLEGGEGKSHIGDAKREWTKRSWRCSRRKAKYEKARDEKSAFEKAQREAMDRINAAETGAERSPVEFMARSKAKISKKRRLRN